MPCRVGMNPNNLLRTARSTGIVFSIGQDMHSNGSDAILVSPRALKHYALFPDLHLF